MRRFMVFIDWTLEPQPHFRTHKLVVAIFVRRTKKEFTYLFRYSIHTVRVCFTFVWLITFLPAVNRCWFHHHLVTSYGWISPLCLCVVWCRIAFHTCTRIQITRISAYTLVSNSHVHKLVRSIDAITFELTTNRCYQFGLAFDLHPNRNKTNRI